MILETAAVLGDALHQRLDRVRGVVGDFVDHGLLPAGAYLQPEDRRRHRLVAIGRRLPAAEIEAAGVDQLRDLLRSPEIIVATWRAARKEAIDLTEAEVRGAIDRLDPLWEELFPAEQARIVQLLVERVDIDVQPIGRILMPRRCSPPPASRPGSP